MAKLIVGLGNPGKEYEKTRHNVGFSMVDAFAENHGISMQRMKFRGFYGEAPIGEHKVILLKPQTFMNISGECVRPWFNFLKVSGRDILVIHDDLDLPLGKLRGQWAGGTGGHNGLASIIDQVGHRDFCRLRVGIGRPSRKEQVVSYVLSSFNEEESEHLEKVLTRGREALEIFIKLGLDPMMQMINTKPPAG